MIVGLNAGFGESLSGEFDGLAAHGFAVVRQDVFATFDEVRAVTLVSEFALAPVQALFLIGGGHIQRPDGSVRIEPHELAAWTTIVVQTAQYAGVTDYAIEIGNEPDIAHPGYSERPEDFSEAVRQCYEAARTAGFTGPIISGGISNLNNRGFTYLERMLSVPMPDDIVIGFHRYPESGRGPWAPHDRFDSRGDEWETLLNLAAARPVACTEFGYHTAQPVRGITLTDVTVAEAVMWDLQFYEDRDALLACVYQLNDGPGDSYLDRYGVRALDGTWKLVAERIRDTYA